MGFTSKRWVHAGACLAAVAVLACGCLPQSNRPNTVSNGDAPFGSVPPPQQQNTGMSTGKKLAILAGTAALIYMYNKHKNAKGAGPQGQYYRSRNGRVYYRDARGNAIWVTPPARGIQVPADEAAIYQRAAQQGRWDLDLGARRGGGYAPAAPRGPGGF